MVAACLQYTLNPMSQEILSPGKSVAATNLPENYIALFLNNAATLFPRNIAVAREFCRTFASHKVQLSLT